MKHLKLTPETKERLVERWKFNKENTYSNLALKFNCSEYQASKAIDEYIKNLKVYL